MPIGDSSTLENKERPKRRILEIGPGREGSFFKKYNIENFEITESDYFNKEIDEEMPSHTKHVLQPCFLSKNRSAPEREFEKYLESLKVINWWYKNGEMRRDYFGIRYEYKNEVYTFYPDYLVDCKDGRIGIFETKSEDDRDEDTYTRAKNEALQVYMVKENKRRKVKKLFGGVVYFKNGSWKIKDNKTDSELNGLFN
jgi:type III restriction enzyme